MTSKGRISLLIVLGAIVLSALGATTASAELPEFYGNGKGSVKFTGSNGGAEVYVGSVYKSKWVCKKGSSMAGTINGRNGISHTGLAFNAGCGFGFCDSPWELKGEYGGMKGKIGYVGKKEAGGEVGLLLEAPYEAEPLIGECEGAFSELYKFSGSVVATIEPVNIRTNKFTVKFEGSEGRQNPREFEGAGSHNLMRTEGEGSPEGLDINVTYTITTEQELELKA